MNRHLASEQISWWIAGERTAEAQRHVAECAQCRREVDRVQEGLSDFRESGQRWSEHWYAVREARRERVWFWRRPAFAGGLVLAMLATLLVAPRQALVTQAEEPFLEIPYVAPLAPYEHTTVRRMDVPVAALIAAGFEVHLPETGGMVTVDVLVGQDGRAHAIRPIKGA
jgi:hypothetical protein